MQQTGRMAVWLRAVSVGWGIVSLVYSKTSELPVCGGCFTSQNRTIVATAPLSFLSSGVSGVVVQRRVVMLDQSSPVRVRAVAAFVIGALFFAYAFVHRVAPSVMTSELMQAFSVGGAALGGLSALYFYAYVAMQVPVGLLMDRYQTRDLMALALLVCALGSLGLAGTESFLIASVCRLIIGASLAFAFVGTLTIAHRWFPGSQFALLAGIAQSSGMLGAVIGQAPQRMLVEQIGWRGSTLVLVAVGVILAALAHWVVPTEGKNSKPAQHHDHTSWSVVSSTRNWVCAMIGFGIAAPMLGFAALWAVPWLVTTRGFVQTDAAAIASLVFVGWMIGSPLAGWLSDRLGRRKPVLFGGATISLLALAAILYLPAANSSLLSVLFFVQGIGGGAMAVLYSVIRDLNPPSRAATALGMLNMVVVGSGAVMQPLIGRWLDHGWDGRMVDGARIYNSVQYEQAFSVLLLLNLFAIVMLLWLRETGSCRLRRDADNVNRK